MQADAALETGLHDGTPYAPLYQHKNENERKAEKEKHAGEVTKVKCEEDGTANDCN